MEEFEQSSNIVDTCSSVLLLYVGSHLIKIAVETNTLLPPANSRKEFRAVGSIGIMASLQRHSSGSQIDPPTYGNADRPLRLLR